MYSPTHEIIEQCAFGGPPRVMPVIYHYSVWVDLDIILASKDAVVAAIYNINTTPTSFDDNAAALSVQKIQMPNVLHAQF